MPNPSVSRSPAEHSRIENAASHDLVHRSFRLMERWDDAEAARIIGATMNNAESESEPPETRQPGVDGLRATHDWLHRAYEDLRWTVHTVVAEGDWAACRTTMSGRQTGDFVTYSADGEVARVFPATGRRFAAMQTRWYRIRDGKLVEHHADRDDLGQAVQLGWLGPAA